MEVSADVREARAATRRKESLGDADMGTPPQQTAIFTVTFPESLILIFILALLAIDLNTTGAGRDR